jgi:PAS domain S-box-containing protein
MTRPRLPTAWRLVLETALDAVVIMDRDGMVVDWNDNATEVFGWTAGEVRGRLMASFIIPERFREAHAAGLQHFLATSEAKVLGRRIEIFGLRRSGEEFPVELSISPVSENGDQIFVGFLRDISERRNAERQREQHALKMEALYRAISFAAENNSFDEALKISLESVHKLTGWPLGHVFLPSADHPVRLLPSPVWYSTRPLDFGRLRAATAATSFAPGEGLPGRVWQTREPEWISDVNFHSGFPRARWEGGIEIRSALGFPIISSHEVIAVIEFFAETVEQPDSELLLTLRAIGQQLGRVFERRRAEQALRDHASALEAEIAERIRAEEHQKFLLAEVNHRVKNMLAVVTAIAAQTARNSVSIGSFSQSFLARLNALNGAHSLLTRYSWRAVSMADLAEAVLSPYSNPEQFEIGGEPLMLSPKAALSVGLVLHELVTNAAKYGALSVPAGRVALHWETGTRAEPWMHLRWEEWGVGPVAVPSRTGFGSAMIRASVQHDLKGNVNIRYGDDGVHYSVEFPLKPAG